MNETEIKQLVKSPMFKNMMGEQAEDIEKMVDKDPAMVKQMMGFWKQLDEMHATDEKGYQDFIKKQKSEFEQHQKEKQEEMDKKRIIQS